MRVFAPLTLLGVGLVACSLDFDRLDPRQQGSGGAPSSSTTSTVASTSSTTSSTSSTAGGMGTGGMGAGGAGGDGGAVPCGNGVIDQGEECDDANAELGDGCEHCQVECTFGFEHPTTHHCYVVVSTNHTWSLARDACNVLGTGYELVGFSSQAEFDWLVARPPVAAVLANNHLYTGGNDILQEGTFVYDNGEAFAAGLWAPNQPDNGNGTSGGASGEDCVHIRIADQLLNDIDCTTSSPFVCERPPAGN